MPKLMTNASDWMVDSEMEVRPHTILMVRPFCDMYYEVYVDDHISTMVNILGVGPQVPCYEMTMGVREPSLEAI